MCICKNKKNEYEIVKLITKIQHRIVGREIWWDWEKSFALIFLFVDNGFSHSVDWFVSFVFSKFKVNVFEDFVPPCTVIELFSSLNNLSLMLNVRLFSLFDLSLFFL